MFKKFLVIIFILTSPFAEFTVNEALCERSCPPGGIPQIDEEMRQIGILIGQGRLDPNKGMSLAKELVALKETCAGIQSQGPSREQCAQKRREFNRCRHEVNKKIASGLNPRYTCVNPEC